MRWLLVPVMLLCWWNMTAPVRGRLLDSEACSLITLPYATAPCSIAIGFRGALPPWLQTDDVALAILELKYPELQEVALGQICPCRTLGLSPSPVCPPNLHAAFERLKQLCPFQIQFLSFPYKAVQNSLH